MFTKGMAKVGGRRKGTPNKLTGTFRDAVLIAYEDIGGHKAFAKWAAENRGDFYRICARLIPAEAKSQATEPITVIIRSPHETDKANNGTIVPASARSEIVNAPKIVHSALIASAHQE